jgi:hypothetical protein
MPQAWHVVLAGLGCWGAFCAALVAFVWCCRGVKAPTPPISEA